MDLRCKFDPKIKYFLLHRYHHSYFNDPFNIHKKDLDMFNVENSQMLDENFMKENIFYIII